MCTFANEIDLPNKQAWRGGGEVSAVRDVGAKEIKLLRVQTETNKKKHEGGWEMPAWEFRVDIHRRMEEKGEQGEVAATGRTCLTSIAAARHRNSPHFTKDLVIPPPPTQTSTPTHTHHADIIRLL